MNVILTETQAADLNFECFGQFIKAAFYTGHSMVYIREMVSSPAYQKERDSIVALAIALGMNDTDTIKVK